MKERRPEAELNALVWQLLMEVGKPSPYDPARLFSMDDLRDLVARDYGVEIAERIRITRH